MQSSTKVFDTKTEVWFTTTDEYLRVPKLPSLMEFSEFEQGWVQFEKVEERNGRLVFWNKNKWSGSNPRCVTGEGVWVA